MAWQNRYRWWCNLPKERAWNRILKSLSFLCRWKVSRELANSSSLNWNNKTAKSEFICVGRHLGLHRWWHHMLAAVGIPQGTANVYRCFEGDVLCVAELGRWRSLPRKDDIKVCFFIKYFFCIPFVFCSLFKRLHLSGAIWRLKIKCGFPTPTLGSRLLSSHHVLVIDHFEIFRHNVETTCSELCSVELFVFIKVALWSSLWEFLELYFECF